MKDNLEKAKDILYNISDYLIMGTIIIAIALIISWRLDILFPKTSTMANVDTPTKVENIETPIEEAKKEDLPIEDKKNIVEEEILVAASIPEETAEIINVSIPKGAPSTNIGNILVDKGLVSDVKEFENKVKELSLEKNLRSGEYDIEKDASLETIVKIIANIK